MKHIKKSFVLSYLKCSNCGEFVLIPRRVGRQKKGGHIKDMWCPYCQTETKFIEHGNYARNGLGEEIDV